MGYDDTVPLTVMGRILGAVIMMLGIGMVALPTGMLASRFSEVMHRQQELFISRGEARPVIANCIDKSKRQLNFCPSCGGKLPDIK